jgi:ribosomal protein L40E
MDFLEDLFDFGDRKHRKRRRIFGQDEVHDHHSDCDDHDRYYDDDFHPNYSGHNPLAVSNNQATPKKGSICPNCSTGLVNGAKFCHQCGTKIEIKMICSSCGSNLPFGGAFCPQCGYKSI